jgi:glutamine synthetase
VSTTETAAKLRRRSETELLSAHPAEGGEFVFVGMPDVNGSIRGKALRPAAFESALLQGTVMTDLFLALDPTDTPITDYARFGIRSGAGDLLVKPDASTLHPLTWRPGWRVCLATPSWLDGSPCELACREVLRRVLSGLSEIGYESLAALEYEVRVWDAAGNPLSTGLSYSLAELERFDALVAALAPALDALGVELMAVHTEAGPGLLELNLAARPGLRAADDATMTKLAVKGLASSMGLRASFLAKTAPGEEGSSGHIHLSCWRDGKSAFAAPATGSMPPLFSAAVAGLLEHLPAASLLLNPTINSYKRLVPGWFAPVNASWGIENRSTAVRAIVRPDHPELCRLECRRPGADANPYLALAAVVASAADGIRRKATPPPPVEGDAYAQADLPELPGSLESALRAFDADRVLRQALDERFSEYYATSRAWELKAWRGTVTDWERERYGPTV